ncbi:endonuclease domain-containing protein [Quadrisphaera sp. KR29]|uniref:endonuclease domain-containing protein n=1 Tax=Quadrisphaera sp. KR29 TaxID=3461391 RepID=UPI0040448D2A
MPHVRTLLPVQLRNRPFTVAEARRLGVTEKRLRSSDLRTPFRGVKVGTALDWTVALRAQCALLAAPDGCAVVGDDAVELHRLPTPFGARPAMDTPVSLLVPQGTTAPRRTGLSVHPHRLHPEAPLWRVAGVLVPGVEDLWAVRCADLDDESGIALGDAVLRRLKGDRTPMSAAVGRLPVDQRARATRLLSLVRYEVCSPVETRLRLLLLQAGLPPASHFAAPIPREGRAAVWPDLQWDPVRVAVEVDGPHHAQDAQHERDIRRDRLTEHHGWTQVKVSSREVMGQPADVVRWVSDALRGAGLRW